MESTWIFFLTRQPKDRMIRKLGQQLRINRSKIKEASDTNTDFDDWTARFAAATS